MPAFTPEEVQNAAVIEYSSGISDEKLAFICSHPHVIRTHIVLQLEHREVGDYPAVDVVQIIEADMQELKKPVQCAWVRTAAESCMEICDFNNIQDLLNIRAATQDSIEMWAILLHNERLQRADRTVNNIVEALQQPLWRLRNPILNNA